jgi:uncharacterized membrane-anchored protein
MSLNLTAAQKSIGLRFWLILTAQVMLVLSIPAHAAYLYMTGKTIALQTGPVDPYSPLQGYYVTLRYDISNPQTLETLPGWDDVAAASAAIESPDSSTPSLFTGKTPFYVILAAPTNPAAQPPQPWQPVAVSIDRPTSLSANQVVLQGTYRQGQIRYGLERYFIPEARRDEINQQIAQLQPADKLPYVVEVKVGTNGEAVPLGVWIGDRQYQF